MTLTYSSINELVVFATGENGIEELCEEIEESKVSYSFVKIIDQNTKLPRFCPDGAHFNQKAAFNSHVRIVGDFFKLSHLQYNGRSEEDMDPEILRKMVEDCSGAKYSQKLDDDPKHKCRIEKKVPEHNPKSDIIPQPSSAPKRKEETKVESESGRLEEYISSKNISTGISIEEIKNRLSQSSLTNLAPDVDLSVNRKSRIADKLKIFEKGTDNGNEHSTNKQDATSEKRTSMNHSKHTNAIDNPVMSERSEQQKNEIDTVAIEIYPQNSQESDSSPNQDIQSKPDPILGECVVVFDYEAAEDGELSMKEGDLITCVDQLDDVWWEGTLRGERGLFPKTYVQLALPVEPSMSVTALYEYIAQHEDELSMKEGDIIKNVKISSDDWWFGYLGSNSGLFPSSYVQKQQ